MDNKEQETRRICTRNEMALAALWVVLTTCFLGYSFAFAAMVNPDLQGIDWWKEVLAKMYGTTSFGFGTIPASAGLIIGVLVFCRGCRRLWQSRGAPNPNAKGRNSLI